MTANQSVNESAYVFVTGRRGFRGRVSAEQRYSLPYRRRITSNRSVPHGRSAHVPLTLEGNITQLAVAEMEKRHSGHIVQITLFQSILRDF